MSRELHRRRRECEAAGGPGREDGVAWGEKGKAGARRRVRVRGAGSGGVGCVVVLRPVGENGAGCWLLAMEGASGRPGEVEKKPAAEGS